MIRNMCLQFFPPLSLFLLIMKVFRTTVEEIEDLALFKLMRKIITITLKSLRSCKLMRQIANTLKSLTH